YQGGVDVFSAEKKTAIECKYKNARQGDKKIQSALKTEMKNAVSEASTSDYIKFNHFILVSTFAHDKILQDYALELQAKHKYPFTISYIGWEEIQKWLFQYPHILERYFGNIHGARVELVGINTDSANCSWIPFPSTSNAFEDIGSVKSPFPIFDFSFVNHLSKTIVLKSIRLRIKGLYSGLSGMPRASVLKPLHKYVLNYDYSLGENILLADPPITVPSGQSFRFQVQVSKTYNGKIFAPDDRFMLYFAFDFNSDIIVVAPDILLNTETDDDFVQLFYAS
ncbi:MAG: hypothetical protein M3R17_09535, partial [Bacteroidota bacterium]|nr:hypothetical protein [Bacteroidota bacterium]